MNRDTVPSPNSPLQTWISGDGAHDGFNARLASLAAITTNDFHKFDLNQSASGRAPSRQTSTSIRAAHEYDLSSIASANVPELVEGSPTLSTSSLASSDIASIIDGGCVLSTEDGILTRPTEHHPDSDLPCLFQILNCDRRCSTVVEFKMHVFSHFRGYPLPPIAPCFLCGRAFPPWPEDDVTLIWNDMLDHMVYEHYRSDTEVFILKPDVSVMRYMWNRKIIGEAEFTRSQLCAVEFRISRSTMPQNVPMPVPGVPMAPSAPVPLNIRQYRLQSVGSHDQPFTMNSGRRQDRRQARRRDSAMRPT